MNKKIELYKGYNFTFNLEVKEVSNNIEIETYLDFENIGRTNLEVKQERGYEYKSLESNICVYDWSFTDGNINTTYDNVTNLVRLSGSNGPYENKSNYSYNLCTKATFNNSNRLIFECYPRAHNNTIGHEFINNTTLGDYSKFSLTEYIQKVISLTTENIHSLDRLHNNILSFIDAKNDFNNKKSENFNNNKNEAAKLFDMLNNIKTLNNH
tara:strand:- start:44 stop:676 length:633 start_codon:yes stop_codon:yes gene_type:complete